MAEVDDDNNNNVIIMCNINTFLCALHSIDLKVRLKIVESKQIIMIKYDSFIGLKRKYTKVHQVTEETASRDSPQHHYSSL